MVPRIFPYHVSRLGRTPLIRLISKALNYPHRDHELPIRAARHDAEHERLSYMGSRRNFLLGSAATLAAAYAAPVMARVKKEAPHIVIVGAGIAGLNAAYVLRQSGYRATVYEASQRVGGRIHTAHGEIAPGLVTELGGEFIDTAHKDMLALARAFELPLINTQVAGERDLKTAYFFGERHYSEEQVMDAFRPLASRIATDAARLSSNITARRHSSSDAEFDAISLAEYLQRIGATGWMRDLIDVAYVAEYGLDASELSCINLISLIDTNMKEGFQIFGDSDERYRIQGGNNRITDELARRIGAIVELEHRMVSMRRHGEAFRVTFTTPSKTTTVNADWVVLTLPFTLLREVDMGDVLPPAKVNAVRNLGYGTNAKLVLGVETRLWREQGFSGECYSDEAFQTGWDSSRQQAGSFGAYTFFFGGKPGVEIGAGTADERAQLLTPAIDQVFPGLAARRTKSSLRIHWPSEPFALGSYSCFRPGQWTQINGEISRRAGNLLFAGEHCSSKFQGYMNGAAETGRHAAHAIINALR
jgi:monoamine oxidase